MKSIKAQQGFTLIELVVVIVILGILAVTAAPKFIDLQTDAKTATLQAVKASMESAKALVHGKSLIKGNDKLAAASTVFVTVNGTSIEVAYGYPKANYGTPAATFGDWSDLIELNSTEFATTVIGSDLYVYLANDTAPATAAAAKCVVKYVEATATTVPVVSVVPCE